MGERAIQNRIRRLQELDRQQAEIEAEREKLKEEIKELYKSYQKKQETMRFSVTGMNA